MLLLAFQLTALIHPLKSAFDACLAEYRSCLSHVCSKSSNHEYMSCKYLSSETCEQKREEKLCMSNTWFEWMVLRRQGHKTWKYFVRGHDIWMFSILHMTLSYLLPPRPACTYDPRGVHLTWLCKELFWWFWTLYLLRAPLCMHM